MFLPEDVFNTSVGHFWGIHETRPYMRSRFAVIEALKKFDTRVSVEQQLEHMMDLLRLCRSDNMGVRSLVPSTMLRFKKDQECYDFIKWHCTTGHNSDYDWGNMDLPYCDIKDADVLEPVDSLCGKYENLSMVVGATLLKIRLLFDATDRQNTSSAGPDEMSYQRSSIVVSNDGETVAKLPQQVTWLYEAVKMRNKHFWSGLLSPEENLAARPPYYSPGAPEEMQYSLQYCYKA